MRTLRGRVIAVIGGANGIGAEVVRQLADAGAKVVVGDRDGEAAERTAAALSGEALGLTVDVTDPDSLEAFLAAIDDAHGHIDALINSAGVMWVGAFETEPDSATRAQLDVNLRGAIVAVKAVAPRMLRRRSGHIIVIASAASLLPTPGEATYAASKHGVLGYLKAVRVELRGRGVDVSVVMPTVVETALAAGTSSGAASMLQPTDVAAAVLKTLQRPRFEVPIPAYLGPARRAIDILPLRLRDAVLRRLVPEQVRATDRAARAEYEAKNFGTPD